MLMENSNKRNKKTKINTKIMEDEPIEQVQQKPSKYFQPYKPTFVTKRTITAPIYFNNGKFYNDEEELNKKVRQDRPRMEVPPYEKLDITALGDPRNKENMNVCWNCGSEDHRYTVCPQPRDDAMINEYRNRIKKPNGPNFGRFFVELELRNQIVTLRPGKISLELQKALGLNRRHPEPPYYTKMRQNGYPPGYWKSPKERDELLSQWKNPTAWSEEMLYDDNADLKIYSDPASYEQNDMDEDGPVKRVGTNKRVKLVHYPGLDKWENLHKRRRTTTAEPHLDYTYAPAYYLAEDSSPSIMMNDDDYTATTTPPTANFETTYHDPPNHESSIALQQQQSSVLPPEQQYQYYHYYYSAYPFFQYQLPVQEQQEQPQVWQAPSQSRLHNIPNNDELATPVSYTSNKGEEGQEEDEMDMDISDDD
ncbi:hypothetical protein BDA99DRAFT_233204 [Phascolomyces articulosus]|uniref:PSP proline-rich domain-containing protein n=1 Tax=Phascolomyces articulosus TaxID=60185 RepID=A0AAD5K0H6_9FUNG|nr:hypothetical protein BDA99DRAFT_233204 [Phascolomyces articulosus]